MSPEFNNLLYRLYGCAQSPVGWSDALDALACTLDVQTVALQWCHIEQTRLIPSRSLVNGRAWAVHQRYTERISDALNPRMNVAQLRVNTGLVVQDRDILPDPRNMGRFQEQMASIGLGRFLGCACTLEDGSYLTLALHQAEGVGRDYSPEQIQMTAALLPHLQQIAKLADGVSLSQGMHRDMAGLVNAMRYGVILCDTQGKVDWSNQAAQQMLEAGGPLRSEFGSLRCGSKTEHQALGKALASHKTEYLSLGRELERARLQLCVQALPEPAKNQTQARSGGRRIVVLTQAHDQQELPPEAIASLFQLTPAEARLTAALCKGIPLDQYAQERGISVGTVRGQAKQILAKTQTARQSDLVRLVLSSVVVQSAPQQMH